MKKYIFEDGELECENLSGSEIQFKEQFLGRLKMVIIDGKRIPCLDDQTFDDNVEEDN